MTAASISRDSLLIMRSRFRLWKYNDKFSTAQNDSILTSGTSSKVAGVGYQEGKSDMIDGKNYHGMNTTES
ncbi:unnamed protein product [Periconia digitata]|uniref:Uncharacterized protein n=1 Tax=Periconia digitata TaxID=1303443 RepID=A0A9W4UB18_9PLEO|nr:unnamed protein product [Periconia digitata]